MLAVNVPASHRYVEILHLSNVEFNCYVTDTSCSWFSWLGIKFLVLSAQMWFEIVPTSR